MDLSWGCTQTKKAKQHPEKGLQQSTDGHAGSNPCAWGSAKEINAGSRKDTQGRKTGASNYPMRLQVLATTPSVILSKSKDLLSFLNSITPT